MYDLLFCLVELCESCPGPKEKEYGRVPPHSEQIPVVIAQPISMVREDDNVNKKYR